VTGKIVLAILLATAMPALTTAVKAEEEWRLMWTNPRVQQVPNSAAVELIRMVPGSTIPYPYTDEDGGYTFHIHFKAGPKIYWISSSSPVNYTRIHAEFAWKVVAAWNASLRFAAENYEWGRHLSKLRLKFYTDANVSKAPRVDIVIDPTTPPGACGAYAAACAVFENPIKIWGGLFELSHELGHVLGLGHEHPQFRGGEGFDWRGYGVIGLYPAPRTPSPPTTLPSTRSL